MKWKAMGFYTLRLRLCRFLFLSRAERNLLVEACVLLGSVRLGLMVLPFPLLRRFLAKASEAPFPAPAPAPASAMIVWAIAAAGRFLPGTSTCLARALAAQVFFERMGHACQLRIGVAKVGMGELRAHAWLESGGAVVIGAGGLEHYSPMPALGSP